MWTEKELMDHYCATKSEARKFRTLSLYFNYLQLKGEASLGVSHITKENIEEFKSHPRHWINMDRRFQEELDYYLNSPVSDTSEELSLSSCDNFSSKDDSTSCSSSDKINFDPETFETHVFVATSDVESVNSADDSTPLPITSNGETTKPNPLSMTHGEATPKPSNINDNGIDDSSCFEFHFDIKPFEDHLNNSTSHLKR